MFCGASVYLLSAVLLFQLYFKGFYSFAIYEQTCGCVIMDELRKVKRVRQRDFYLFYVFIENNISTILKIIKACDRVKPI